jgi:hypothetical protein
LRLRLVIPTGTVMRHCGSRRRSHHEPAPSGPSSHSHRCNLHPSCVRPVLRKLHRWARSRDGSTHGPGQRFELQLLDRRAGDRRPPTRGPLQRPLSSCLTGQPTVQTVLVPVLIRGRRWQLGRITRASPAISVPIAGRRCPLSTTRPPDCDETAIRHPARRCRSGRRFCAGGLGFGARVLARPNGYRDGSAGPSPNCARQ